jgi:hypothetical protein
MPGKSTLPQLTNSVQKGSRLISLLVCSSICALLALWLAIPTAFAASLSLSATGVVAGQVDTPYGPVVLTASGAAGTATYGWSLIAGGLPPGLLLDTSATSNRTTISGTPVRAGTYTFTIQVATSEADTPASQTYSVAVSKGSPTITWSTPADISYGRALSGAQLNAYPTVGAKPVAGALTYAPGFGAVLNAGNFQLLSVAFTPYDSENYYPASAAVFINVAQSAPVISWEAPLDITYGTALDARHLKATVNAPGALVYSPPAGTLLSVGDAQTLSVRFQPLDPSNVQSTSAQVAINVRQATPVVTWRQPAQIVHGTSLGSTQLNATAAIGSTSVAGTFTYSPPLGALLEPGAHLLSATFTPGDALNFAAISASTSLTVVPITPNLTWPEPLPITYGAALSDAQLNAATTTPGTFSYTPDRGTILSPGIHTLRTTFTPEDPTRFSMQTASVMITVEKVAPEVRWEKPADITYGVPIGATQLNATSSLPGNLSYTPGPETILEAGARTLIATFTPDDPSIHAAASASVQITVAPAAQLTTVTPPVVDYRVASAPLNAVLTSDLPVNQGTMTFTVTDAGGAAVGKPVVSKTVSNGTATASFPLAGVSAGTYTITATHNSQNFWGAPATTVLTVSKITPHVTWSKPAAITYGTPIPAKALNAKASVPGTFEYTIPAGTVLSAGNAQILSLSFTPNDSTNYNLAGASTTIDVLPVKPSLKVKSVTTGYGTNSAELVAQIISTTPIDTGSVTFTVLRSGVTAAASPANPVSESVAATNLSLSGLGAGSYQIRASYSGGDNYAASTATGLLLVKKAQPQIAWPTPADITYGSPLGPSQLNALATVQGSSIAGTFRYGQPIGTVLPVGLGRRLSATFTPADSTNFAPISSSVLINVLPDTTRMFMTNSTATSGSRSVPLTARLSSSTGRTISGGTVSFVVLRGDILVGSLRANVVNGVASATFALSGLPSGAYLVRADYSGSPNFVGGSTTSELIV